MSTPLRTICAALVMAATGTVASAQESIDAALRATGTGTVRLQFKARPGVCGSGQSWSVNTSRRSGEWENSCEPGPVRVAIDVTNGAPSALRFYVGGRWSASPGGATRVTDINSIAAAEAGRWFVRLAESASGRVAREAISIATLADSSTIWPQLLRIAKDGSRDRELRKSAVFWLGQATSDATAVLNGLAEDESGDIEVRTQAVFALSQRPRAEGVPILLSIARGTLDARVRRQAIFWLGQSEDPRALAYFEDVLTRP